MEKPIEKYQKKFIELLKEAELELGDYLTIKVCSGPISMSRNSIQNVQDDAYAVIDERIYKFELHTNSYVV